MSDNEYSYGGCISADHRCVLWFVFLFLFRFFYFMQLIKKQLNMKTKKIRIFDNGNGLLISVKDILFYLNETGVIGDKKSKITWWKYYMEIFEKLRYQYRTGETSIQINIFDFQDMFICWAELWLLKKYFTDIQKHKPVFWKLFLILDSPNEIKTSDLFEYYEPFKGIK